MARHTYLLLRASRVFALGLTFFITITGTWMTLQRDINFILTGNTFLRLSSYAIPFLAVISIIFWTSKTDGTPIKQLAFVGGLVSFFAWQIIDVTEWLETGPPLIYSPVHRSTLNLLPLAFFVFGAILSLSTQLFTKSPKVVLGKPPETTMLCALYVCFYIGLMWSLFLNISPIWFLALIWGFLGATLVHIVRAGYRSPDLIGCEVLAKQDSTSKIFFGSLPIVALVIFLMFQGIHSITKLPFFSDESIYVYTSYAISRGLTPYKEVTMVHPPLMFAIYAALIRLVGNEIYPIRFFNVILFIVNVSITYLLAKTSQGNRFNGKLYGIISMLCYGLYYYNFIPTANTANLENILTFFTISSSFFLTRFLSKKDRWGLFISGFLGGCALMTKYLSIMFLILLVIFYILAGTIEKYKPSEMFKEFSYFLFGVAIVPTIIMAWVMASGIYENFYQQTYYWHIVRYGEGSLKLYYDNFLPLLFAACVGTMFLLENIITTKRVLLVLPICLFEICVVFTLGLKVILSHYFYYLSPYLAMLTAASLYFPFETITTCVRDRRVKRKLMALGLVIMVLVGLMILVIPRERLRPLEESYYMQVELEVGNYVSSLTTSNEKVWTSEGSIAFFAGRLIVPPNSRVWPLQGFFEDVFSFVWRQDISNQMKDYRYGIVTVEEFISSWEIERPKVIIIIKGEGPIPYPDELMWNGFRGHEGIAEYVETHYTLYHIHSHPEVPYLYEIWVRRDISS